MKIERIHAAILTFENGTTAKVERIGKGRYSTAWKNGTSVYVQTHEDDYAKQILCKLNQKHLPKVEFLESCGMYNWYKMPLYQPLTAKCKTAWADFKMLKQAQNEVNIYMRMESPATKQDWIAGTIGRYSNEHLCDLVDDSAYLSTKYSDTLRSLTDWCATYGEGWMIEELQPRNCAVDQDGELILLDPIFDLVLLRLAQNKKRNLY